MLRWEIHPLSLFGRTETVRMNVAQIVFFLILPVPVGVTMATFKTPDR